MRPMELKYLEGLINLREPVSAGNEVWNPAEKEAAAGAYYQPSATLKTDRAVSLDALNAQIDITDAEFRETRGMERVEGGGEWGGGRGGDYRLPTVQDQAVNLSPFTKVAQSGSGVSFTTSSAIKEDGRPHKA